MSLKRIPVVPVFGHQKLPHKSDRVKSLEHDPIQPGAAPIALLPDLFVLVPDMPLLDSSCTKKEFRSRAMALLRGELRNFGRSKCFWSG